MNIKSRSFWLAVILVVSVAINIYMFWPRKQAQSDRFGGPGGPGGPDGGPGMMFADPSSEQGKQMEERFNQMLENLPEDQRTAMKERFEKDRAFFSSIKDLPEDERREKAREYFEQNPPPRPPGGEGGPGNFGPGQNNDNGAGPGGPGAQSDQSGPGGGGAGVRIPAPEQRQAMDSRIIESQHNSSDQ